MEGRNGHPEIGSFEWLQARRLTTLEAQGISADDLNSLKARGRQISAALESFRTQQRTLSTSGRYTASGLAEALAEHAATAAGEIRRTQDISVLLQHISQVEAKLASRQTADPMDKLYRLMLHQEIRSHLEAQGITSGDPIAADLAYREAATRGDFATCEALEGWPLGSPVSAYLIAQGQEQRHAASDPVNAKKLADLQRFKAAMESATHDALVELKVYLPTDDPVERMAQGEPPDDAA